jgi:hypothetical protein
MYLKITNKGKKMNDLETLQDFINQQALDKLNRDINKWFDKVNGSPFFDCIKEEVIESTSNSLKYDFSTSGSTLKSKIRKKMLPSYIEAESRKYFHALQELENKK